MGLDGIAISGRGALAQAYKIEALVRTIANAGNGQRVGSGKFDVANGQLVGLGQSAVNGQLAGYGEVGQYGDRNGQRVGVLETADLLSALRALEANLQALRIQDATLERTVNELARPAK
jgi:hypothetical protein